jgi:hypothetical protein
MINQLKYRITKGLPWERLIMVKDKDSHRIIKPLDSWGLIKTGDISRMELTTALTTEGGVVISLSEEETKDLPVGTLEFDVMAVLPRKALTTGGSTTVTTPIAKGTIIVTDIGTVTPLEEIDYMELRFSEGEDFYRTFTWRDSEGTIVTVQNAYMQAANSSGTTVLDLRWYSTPPNEATIAGLTANRRGYISPASGASLIVHISNTNTIAAGTYDFDIFVQDAAGDWSRLTKGALVVESSVSVMP